MTLATKTEGSVPLTALSKIDIKHSFVYYLKRTEHTNCEKALLK
jgi:hypothetical protein